MIRTPVAIAALLLFVTAAANADPVRCSNEQKNCVTACGSLPVQTRVSACISYCQARMNWMPADRLLGQWLLALLRAAAAMSRYSVWVVSPPNYIHSQAFDEVAQRLQRGVPRARP